MIESLSRNIVILGARSDIGSELVRLASSNRDARIVAVSRTRRAAEVPMSNTQWLTGIDLTVEADLITLASVVGSAFSAPFSVVHSVGDFWLHKPLVGTSFHELVSIVNSHVITLLGVARFLTPIMKRSGGGRLVAFSCNSVGYNYPDLSPFTAAKAAVESFVKSYANEHSEFGISATALALPTIRTQKVLAHKTGGDHENYIATAELADFVLRCILSQPHEINGNTVKLFKHSPTFYHSSYYDRNPRRDCVADES